jgi:hypothetical protein
MIDTACSWQGKLNIIKTSVIPKLISKLNKISINNPEGFFFTVLGFELRVYTLHHSTSPFL